MGNYVSVADVRRTCGISSDLISDSDVSGQIDIIEKKVDRMLNCTSVPKTIIEVRDGNGKREMFVRYKPLLRLVSMKIDGITVTPDYVFAYPSGKLLLSSLAEKSTFSRGNPQEVALKYIHGRMEQDISVQTAITADAEAGDDVDVEVTTSSAFSDDDWIEIVGTDGKREVTQATNMPDATTITCNISQDHVSGSMVTKMAVPNAIKRFTEILTSMSMVARVVGQSFDEITGHDLGDMRVQKGEPYTQWRETAVWLEKERDELKKALRPIPAIAVQ